jgi:hypothetical protein
VSSLPKILHHVARNDRESIIDESGAWGIRTRRRSLIVIPGAIIRERVREHSRVWSACFVDRVPCNQHGDHGRLASPSRQLHCQADETRVGLFALFLHKFDEPQVSRVFCSDLGQPDDCLGCLNLAVEKRPLTALVAPMKKEARPGAASSAAFGDAGPSRCPRKRRAHAAPLRQFGRSSGSGSCRLR